jgi:hypothetical protein
VSTNALQQSAVLWKQNYMMAKRIGRHERAEANIGTEKSADDEKIDGSESELFVLDSNGVVLWSYRSR